MQVQKFKPNESHGVVYNHPSASFVQNNVLFDAKGDPVETPKSKDVSSNTDDKKKSPKTQKEIPDKGPVTSKETMFLRGILSGGPVTQANIKKESEEQSFIWSDIQLAAVELKIQRSKDKKGISMWKFTGE